MDGNNPNYRIITICHDLQERRVIDRIININKSVPAGYLVCSSYRIYWQQSCSAMDIFTLFSYCKCISIHTDCSSALLQDHVIVTTKIYSVARFANYYCCQNIRKYTPNHTLKAPQPCSPAGYFSSVLHTGCTGSRPVLA